MPTMVITKTDLTLAFGSLTNAAKALGLSRQALYLWDEQLPAEWQVRVKAMPEVRKLVYTYKAPAIRAFLKDRGIL